MAKALRNGTPEPAFYYHAEQIALANGKTKEARNIEALCKSFLSLSLLARMMDPSLERRAAK